MAAGPIAFRSVGSWAFTANNVQTPTTLSPGAPSGKIAGDLIVLVCGSKSITATCSTPTGWTLHPDFPKRSGTAGGGTLYVFLRIADGSSDDAAQPVWSGLTTGTSGDTSSAGILCFQNGSNKVDGGTTQTVDTTATTTTTYTAFTTLVQNSIVIGVALKIQDLAGTSTVATFTEAADFGSANGSGHYGEVSYKLMPTPGSSGTAAITWSNSTSNRTLAVTFGLQLRYIPRPSGVNQADPGVV